MNIENVNVSSLQMLSSLAQLKQLTVRGCTLSSAVAANLAKGFTLAESVQRAKDYISGALAVMLDLGKGSGPLDHGFDLQGEWAVYK